MSSVVAKRPDIHDEFARFLATHGKERSRKVRRLLARGRPDTSWPIVANFFERKGYHTLATGEGLNFFANNLE
ncbi:MAG: hypothetical protein ABIB04_00030 [Patescibacteria group bacterium]